MEVKENPLKKIFKKNTLGLISEELENPSNFSILFDYLKDNSNTIDDKIKKINKLTDIIKNQRSIVAFLPKYENKNIYIFFFDLYFNEKKSKELKDSIINLINILSLNLQITKDVYEYIFQKFSKEYLSYKNNISEIKNNPKSFNENFYDTLNLLFSTFGESTKKKTNPRNYFACFGNNNFIINFNKQNFLVGNFISIIINFKITKSKLITENTEQFGKCNLIKFNFADINKTLDIQLKYPFFLILNDGKKEYTAKVCPLGEWINLIMTLVVNDDGNIKVYFFINGENSLLPIKVKNLKLKTNDIIKSITFFNNFYGEVTSISMLSMNHNDSLNIFSQTLKYFLEFSAGLWNKRFLNRFINYLEGIVFIRKKNEDENEEDNLFNNIVFIFTPFNYSINNPDIVEDCLEKYNLTISGNIRNHRYQNYQKKIMQICSINNFIPIAEMFLIYQNELLNKKNLLLYLKIIAKIVLGKKNLIFMNDYNFFQLLSIFIEKLPNNILNEDILKELENIGINIIKHNIKGFSSYFFKDILLNEKIIFKFAKELQSKFWDIILHFCLTGKEKIESFITMKKICIFLRYYDSNRYNEICCNFHLNMYKKEYIGNIKIMEPTLIERLIYIKKIINIIILNQNPENLISLFKLLMLDLSPCLIKLIINIFITLLNNNNKDEEWKNKLTLGIINNKYDIIIVNTFVHSLPDVRYEILIFMNYIFMRLLKLNKISEFNSFGKMIKTCLLPQDIFYVEKNINLINTQNDFDSIKEFNKKNKNIINNNIDKNIIISGFDENKKKDKSKKDDNNNKNEENNKSTISNPFRSSKSNIIYNLALKFENKNINKQNDNEQKVIKNENNNIKKDKLKKLKTEVINLKNIKDKISEKDSNNNLNNNKLQNNDVKQQNKVENEDVGKNILRTTTFNILKRKDEMNIEYLNFKEGESIYNNNKKETLILREELYDIYINSLYIFFLKWALGIPISYTSSLSSELFSSLKQQKDISYKHYFITNINFFEFIFILNNDLNNIDFTFRCLQNLERLILLPENSFIILLKNKIYSSFLDITFKYYKMNDISESEKELYKIGKNNCVYIFINSLNYMDGKNNELPMDKLENIFLWGEKIILSNINDKKKINLVLDFIYELLTDINNQFIKEFGNKIKNYFELNFNLMELKNNFFIRNYLIYLTYVYNFCIHYQIDPIIKNSDMDAFFTMSLNINIPQIFISGMRMDNSKGNNIREYWKDFNLIENIFNKINYIFKHDFIKKKFFDKNNKENNNEIKNKNDKKENELNYDKYNNMLNILILNKDKRDLFKKELYLLCYYENAKNQREIIIPLIRIISISLICIITIVKDSNDEDQLKYWLKEYKDLIKFTILSSINLNKNTSTQLNIKIYTKIQEICLDVIGAGLCLFNYLYECSIIGKQIIKKYINSIFLLCFSILKYYFDGMKNTKGIKLFNNKLQIDYSQSAVVLLFNEYIKDKNNSPFININKLETQFLNPSFKIIDLINENTFYESLFENNSLKKKLFNKYYSINKYKLIVDNRFNLIRTLDDKIDYSYQINIFDLLYKYESELKKYSNSYIKSRKKINNYYIKQKKLFFSWNGLWSNKKIFYEDINNKTIKYKIINHYSKNLMRPLIAPILDINYYLPKFTEFNKNKLFNINNNDNDNDILYDIIFDSEKLIKNQMINSQINNLNKKEKSIINIKDDENIKINTYINDDNTKKLNRLLKNNDESQNYYIKYLYQKSNPKLYDYLKIISNTLNFWKNTELEEDFNNNIENDDNDIIDNNKFKENDRKDTVQTQRTSSSTIKKENSEENSLFKNNYVNLIYDKDNNKLKNEEILNNKKYFLCCLVKPSHHIKGVIYINDKKLNFKIFSNQKKGKGIIGIQDICFSEKDNDYDYDKDRGTCYGSYFTYHPKDKNLYKISIIFNEIKWILKRKYYYKNSGIEVFTIKNKSYYFNFKDEETQGIIINEITSKIGDYFEIVNDIKELPNINNNIIIGYQNNSNPLISKKCKFKKKEKKKIKLSQIIIQWKNWEFSNFEILILLNIFSNRSYNDISQYPVFPWLLTNYTDPLKTKHKQEKEMGNDNINEKDIEEKRSIEDYTYRDLSLQMGMLTINEDCKNRIKNYLSTYKIIKQEKGMKPYIFGCNYSNATYVCNYLIRLFPFTQITIEIQGDGFDNPNRLFTSIEKTFKNATSQSTDVREIIPEFFYFPEIFLNLNNLNLGKLSGNIPINDVITPCNNNPYIFISTMKNILENENISYNINNWIDLIFGYKAKGKEAENAKNIFTEQSYQEDININDIKDKDNYIRYVEFGLIPNQLFNIKEFPQKEKIEEIKKYKQITDNSYNLKKYNCKRNANVNNFIKLKDDLLLLAINHISQDRLVLFYNTNIYIHEKITYSIFEKEYNEEIIEIKKLTPTLNRISNYYLPYMHNNKNIKIIRDGRIIILGGYYDGKIIIFDTEIINSNKSIIEIFPFRDESPITTIHVDKDEEYLFVGNSLGNIRIIQIENNINEWKMIYLINAHLNSISSINSNNELNIFASSSIDGYINVYTLPLFKLTKSFKLSLNSLCNYIYICDSPLCSIIIICQSEVYLYSINGFQIWYQKESDNIINPIIIKDFYRNDYLAYIINNKEIFIRNISDFSIQAKFENDTEIYYLCPGIDMKILYAINKNGTLINIIISDTKKILDEN